jgi:hypothetical protein
MGIVSFLGFRIWLLKEGVIESDIINIRSIYGVQ